VVLPTEHFGELTLDRTIDWFAGKREWNGVPIDVHFEIGDDGGIVGAITTAERLWADQAAWKRRIDDYAVEQLLPLKNESWLDEGESKLSPKKFKSWMTLTSITVADEGQFQFWHDDGDLFGGHWIEISGNLKDGPNHADIPG
jgi:hypothetical protein